MKIKKTSELKTSSLFFLGAFSWIITSCSNAATEAPAAPDYNQKFDYSLSINADGKLVVMDDKLRTLVGEPAKFPIEAKAIVDVETITIVRALGSHYILVTNRGVTTKYYLKH